MSLVEQIKEILIKNHNIRKYKDDPSIKSNCIRIINMFVAYGFLNSNEKYSIVEFKICKLETLTNFELLTLIDSVIRSKDKVLIDDSFSKLIQSIDYTKKSKTSCVLGISNSYDIGQCWYYPKELSVLIFEATGKRNNYRKIKAILNQLTNDNTCLKITNKKRQSMYRVRFTYSGCE